VLEKNQVVLEKKQKEIMKMLRSNKKDLIDISQIPKSRTVLSRTSMSNLKLYCKSLRIRGYTKLSRNVLIDLLSNR
jgi:phage-related protein